MWYNSNMTSFIGYIHNTMIKLIIYFNLHMPIDDQITIIYLSLGIKKLYENNVTHVKTGCKLWVP